MKPSFVRIPTAQIAILPGWGYGVEIIRGGTVLDSYTAGDSRFDSQVYGTGDLNEATLRLYAYQTAREMLAEKDVPPEAQSVQEVPADLLDCLPPMPDNDDEDARVGTLASQPGGGDRQKAIIVDLDGCLCDTDHRIHYIKESPKDWTAFDAGIPDDPIVPEVAAIVRMAMAANWSVIYITGRDDQYAPEAVAWLTKHGVPGDMLLMRRTHDFRPGDTVKRELYVYHVEDDYDVQVVLEDGPMAAAMWHTLGLPVFTVGRRS